jgi:crotonobetainyl-CoA:carnitine CoA-transferase CaiB-like acyl-CoA transferase
MPDAIGGLTGAVAIASALLERDERGVGRHIDLSQLESYCAISGEAFLYESLTGHPIDPDAWADMVYGAPHGCYRCTGEDNWIALSIETDDQWRALNGLLAAAGLGLQAELENCEARIAAADEVEGRVAAWCGRRTRDDAVARLQSAGVPAFPALNNGELLADEHLATRRMFVTYHQDDVGDLPWPAFPVRLGDGSDPARYATSPQLGSDNEAIATELAGRSRAEYERLREAGILATEPLIV